MFNKRLVDIFAVEESTIFGMFDSAKAKLIFDPVDFVSIIVNELENIDEEETTQYLRILSPSIEPKLVSVHTKKSCKDYGSLQVLYQEV